MSNIINYKCKENDNNIQIVKSDGGYDELHFGTSLKSEGRVVIGMQDLKNALKEAGLEIKQIDTFKEELLAIKNKKF